MSAGGPARARRWSAAGVVTGALVATAATFAFGAGPADALGIGFFLCVLPGLSVAQVAFLDEVGTELERVPVYVSSIGALLVIGAGAWLAATWGEDGGAVGLGPAAPIDVAAWSAALAAAALLVVAAFRVVGTVAGARESLLVRRLLPVTAAEKRTFVGVSLAAGLCEELAYRGFTLLTLQAWIGPGWALLVSSVAFGVLHVYQGPLGALRAGALGGVLGWGLLHTGGLWAPIVAHSVIDLVAGLVVGERLMVPDPVEA